MLVKDLIEKLQQHPADAEVLLEEKPDAATLRRIPFDSELMADTNSATLTPIVLLHRADSAPVRSA